MRMRVDEPRQKGAVSKVMALGYFIVGPLHLLSSISAIVPVSSQSKAWRTKAAAREHQIW